MNQNVSQVKAILICKNSMLREGLKHALSGTRFTPYDADAGGLKPPSDLGADQEPLLFIIDRDLHQDTIAEVVQSTKRQYSSAKIVVIDDEFDMDGMLSILRAGSDGYCLSAVGCDVLVKYLELIMLGEVVFPSAAFLSALPASGKLSQTETAPIKIAEHLQAMSAGSPIRTLSSREAEILHCLMQGAPNKIIARKLDVAEATVKVHIKAILRKIRVTNRTQAAMWAVAHLPQQGGEDSSWSALR